MRSDYDAHWNALMLEYAQEFVETKHPRKWGLFERAKTWEVTVAYNHERNDPIQEFIVTVVRSSKGVHISWPEDYAGLWRINPNYVGPLTQYRLDSGRVRGQVEQSFINARNR